MMLTTHNSYCIIYNGKNDGKNFLSHLSQPPAREDRRKGVATMSKKRLYVSSLAATCFIASAMWAASQNFLPDVTFKGSSLTGWHKLGEADWRANNGEITGTPKRESGGWLVLDQGYQDVQLSASFRCTGACKAGILLRAEKTPDGMKGVYLSLNEGDVAPYEVVLDAQGAEVSRAKLPAGPGPMIRMATARPNGADELVNGFSKLAPTVTEYRAANPTKAGPSDGGPRRARRTRAARRRLEHGANHSRRRCSFDVGQRRPGNHRSHQRSDDGLRTDRAVRGRHGRSAVQRHRL